MFYIAFAFARPCNLVNTELEVEMFYRVMSGHLSYFCDQWHHKKFRYLNVFKFWIHTFSFSIPKTITLGFLQIHFRVRYELS